MRGHSLLTRIRHPQYAAARRALSDDEVRGAILENLRTMCATRLGSMVTCPDYGVADVSDVIHAFPDAVTMLARSIRATIQTYEPRLTNVHVRYVENDGADLTLRYEISAQVLGDGERRSVRFRTALDLSRKLTIA